MKSGICRPPGYPWLAATPLPLRRRHVLSGLREDVSSKHQPQTPPRETCQAVFRKQRIKNFSLADKFTSLRAQWPSAAGKNLGLRGQLGDEVAGEISGQISGRQNSSTGPGFRYRRASGQRRQLEEEQNFCAGFGRGLVSAPLSTTPHVAAASDAGAPSSDDSPHCTGLLLRCCCPGAGRDHRHPNVCNGISLFAMLFLGV